MLTGIWRNNFCRHRADLDSPVPGHKFGWIKLARSPGFRESSSRVILRYWSIVIIDAKDCHVSDECYDLGYLTILKQFHPHPWSDGRNLRTILPHIAWYPSNSLVGQTVTGTNFRCKGAQLVAETSPGTDLTKSRGSFWKPDLETVPEPWQPRMWLKLLYSNPFLVLDSDGFPKIGSVTRSIIPEEYWSALQLRLCSHTTFTWTGSLLGLIICLICIKSTRTRRF